MSSEEQYRRIANQLEFVQAVLQEVSVQLGCRYCLKLSSQAAERKPTWLLVAGHYPVYSSGEHSDTSELVTYLLPLLRQYGVHAYLSGHDHVSEHLSRDGVEYFVVGAGSMADSMGSSSSATLNWYGAGYSAFGSMLATESSLEMSFVNTDNEVVYAFSLTNPNESGEDLSGYPSAATDSIGEVIGGSQSGSLFVTAEFWAVLLMAALLVLALFALAGSRGEGRGSPEAAVRDSDLEGGEAASKSPDSAGQLPEERPHDKRALSLAAEAPLMGRQIPPARGPQRRFSTFA